MLTFSIIIPTYNRKEKLQRALDSVLAQTYQNFELLVMDDGSNDGTEEMVKSFVDQRIIYEWNENWGGPGRPRNRGINKAKGEWIAFLDSDDWWTKDKLQNSIKKLEETGADILYHDLYLISRYGGERPWLRTWSRILSRDAWGDLFTNGNAISNSSVVVRKTALVAIDGITEERSCITWEDFDTWLRLAERKYIFKKLAGVHGFYWVGGGNISNPQQEIKNVESFILKYLPDRRNSTVPWWCHYSNGLSCNAQKEYQKALSSLIMALKAKSTLMNKLKTIIRLLEIFIKTNSIKLNS